jgi:MEMO1 family protein
MGKVSKSYIMPHPPVVIPEVGKGEEKKVQNTFFACMKVANEISTLTPDTILVITPHGPMFRDAVALSSGKNIKGNLHNFNAPEISYEFELNRDLINGIIDEADDKDIPVVRISDNSMREYGVHYELDHGTMVPLYFINKKYISYKLVHITYGLLSNVDLYRFGIAIQKAIEASDNNVVIIASGDLSHKLSKESPYGYSPEGPKYDSEILSLLKKGDVPGIFSLDRQMIACAGECGMRSIYTLLGTLEGYDFTGEVLSYEGPFGIGYGIVEFESKKASYRNFLNRIIGLRDKAVSEIREKEDIYVRLARESLERYVKNEKYIQMPSYVRPEMLKEARGVFVSLKIDGELRGCIGTISPVTDNCAEEIIRNAVEAGTRDPRFFPVEEEELRQLEYSVDILMPPEKATKAMLDPHKYGVIVSTGRKSALLLPDLEGVDTVEEQLSIVLGKANISKHENYDIERFEVIRHK